MDEVVDTHSRGRYTSDCHAAPGGPGALDQGPRVPWGAQEAPCYGVQPWVPHSCGGRAGLGPCGGRRVRPHKEDPGPCFHPVPPPA